MIHLIHTLVVLVPCLLFGMMQGRRDIRFWRSVAECACFTVVWNILWYLIFASL